MKQLKLAMLSLLVVFMGIQCSSDEEGFVESTLKLSNTKVEFTEKASNKEVSVETNAKKWSAIAPADWVDFEKKEGKIVIKVLENKTTSSRKAEVVVFAGSTNATIEVVQKASAGQATFNPDKIELGLEAGSVTIDVIANSDDWTAKTDAKWLTLNAKPYKKEIVITYEENKGRKVRTAEIIVTIAGKEQKIIVTQKAVMYFILPYLDWKGSREDIKKFEEERGNKFISKYLDTDDYETKSEYFPNLGYEFSPEGAYKKATLYGYSYEAFAKEVEEYKVFLTENGFKKIDETLFVDEAKKVICLIVLDEYAGVGKVIFKEKKPKPTQPQAQETFTKLPVAGVEWGATNDAIKTYEASNGGILSDNGTSIGVMPIMDKLVFDVDASASNQIPYIRIYFVLHDANKKFKDGLSTARMFYKNTNLAFFKHTDGEFYLTTEFMKLMTDEGFSYDENRNPDAEGYHKFVNESKNTRIQIRVMNSTDGDIIEYTAFRLDMMN
ncbi:MAG: BACON domain-containing protein [Flavobacteriaceae bacterium]|nr:BACON domain-containing protein [Flavobacteriaceae bacterium]